MSRDVARLRLSVAREVASAVRARALLVGKLFSIPHAADLCGLCGVAADGVTRALCAAGFSAESVYGRFAAGTSWNEHCWTEAVVGCKVVVVDVTATQFERVLAEEDGRRRSRHASVSPKRFRIDAVTVVQGDPFVMHDDAGSAYGWLRRTRGDAFDRSLRAWDRQFRAATYRKLKWWGPDFEEAARGVERVAAWEVGSRRVRPMSGLDGVDASLCSRVQGLRAGLSRPPILCEVAHA